MANFRANRHCDFRGLKSPGPIEISLAVLHITLAPNFRGLKSPGPIEITVFPFVELVTELFPGPKKPRPH